MKRIWNKLICILLVSVMTTPLMPVVSNAEENLSLSLTAIGSEEGTEKVIDSDTGTIWTGYLKEGVDAYIGVSAEENKKIRFNTVVVKEADTGKGYGIKGYKIQTSDDLKSWTDIPGAEGEAIGEEPGELYLMQAVYARAVRLLVTGSENSEFAISEFELYDNSGKTVKEDKKADISDKYHEVLLKLQAFGFYEDYNRKSFPFGAGIARGDFLKIIAKVAGGKDNLLKGAEENEEIIISHLKNIMSEGAEITGSLNFLYNDTITYGEAAAVLLSVGGYSRYANAMGGYPDGYMKVSARRKLFDKVSAGSDDIVTNGNFAIMLYNLLMLEPMENVSYSQEISYGVMKDKTVLSSKFDIYEIEGLVEGDGYSMLYGETGLSKNQIMIGGTELDINNNRIGKWLGLYVNCWYYENDDEERTVVYIEENTDDCEKISIDADNIISFGDNTYHYYTNKKRKDSLRLDTAAKLVYNGKFVSDFDTSYFEPLLGMVELTDIDNDKEYDVVRITSYENYIIGGIDLANKLLYAADDAGDILNLNENDVISEIVLENGAMTSIEKLRPKDVLSVKKSQDGTLVAITVSRGKVEGTVKGVNENEDGYREITINEEVYLIEKAYQKKLEEDKEEIQLDSKGTLYLDIFGRIAYAELKKTGANFLGYLTLAKEVDDVECMVMFKIFNEDGELKQYELAEKISVNDTGMEATKENLTNEGFFDANGKTNRQLIAFSLNSELKIKRIYTAVMPQQNSSGTAVLEKSLEMESSPYFGGQMRFRNFLIDSKTIIFAVPSDSFSGSNPDANFKIKRSKDYVNEMSGYNVEAYNMNEVGCASVVVEYINSSQGKVIDNQGIAVVRKVSVGIDSDDEKIIYLHVWENGAEIKYPVIKDPSLNALLENGDCEYGDIITISKNQNGELNLYSKVFDFGDIKDETMAGSLKKHFSILSSSLKSSTNFYSNLQTLFGTVEKKIDDVIALNVNIRPNGETKYMHRISKDSRFYIVDMAGKEIRLGSINDIIEGEDDTAVFLRMRHSKTSEVIIYKNCSYGIKE